jgi:hypothetical protein
MALVALILYDGTNARSRSRGQRPVLGQGTLLQVEIAGAAVSCKGLREGETTAFACMVPTAG